MTKNGIPVGREPLPMNQWQRRAREMGFELRVDHEPEHFTVYVMLKPKTRKAKTAVDLALEDDCELITVRTVYDKASAEMRSKGIEPPPREDQGKHIAIAMDDSITYALTMAQQALLKAEAA